ncbi:hypothetical protein [Streptomyces sp. NPDC002889]|uniref:hypothetical protein n=1 Tax=Streptomyces sp. NPDC002889 TaxID=3364669 RepID=UPI0036AEB082
MSGPTNDPRVPYDGPSDASRPQPPDADDEYSATALGSHWFERPEPEPEVDTPTLVEDHARPADVAPDRVEGDVLRFGPGVTAVVRSRGSGTTAADLWHGTLAGQPASEPEQPRRRRVLRRYALAASVLLAVLVFLAWQRYGPGLAVRGVAVETSAKGPGCDGTADVVGVVRTNGRPGTLRYSWVRSDGTASGELEEKLKRGQKQARLHLLWTFHGTGAYRAAAELRVTSPSSHSASARFLYVCD